MSATGAASHNNSSSGSCNSFLSPSFRCTDLTARDVHLLLHDAVASLQHLAMPLADRFVAAWRSAGLESTQNDASANLEQLHLRSLVLQLQRPVRASPELPAALVSPTRQEKAPLDEASPGFEDQDLRGFDVSVRAPSAAARKVLPQSSSSTSSLSIPSYNHLSSSSGLTISRKRDQSAAAIDVDANTDLGTNEWQRTHKRASSAAPLRPSAASPAPSSAKHSRALNKPLSRVNRDDLEHDEEDADQQHHRVSSRASRSLQQPSSSFDLDDEDLMLESDHVPQAVAELRLRSVKSASGKSGSRVSESRSPHCQAINDSSVNKRFTCIYPHSVDRNENASSFAAPCGDRFSTRQQCENHIRSKHTKERLQCVFPGCNRGFFDRQNLNKHEKSVHASLYAQVRRSS